LLAAPPGLSRDGLHLPQRGKPPEGFQLDLPEASPCDADQQGDASLLAAPPGLSRDGLHLPQRGKPPEGFQLDLPYPLAGEAEAAPDLLEGLRLGVVEPVAQDQHLPLALVQRRERL
jgi:hypothetical protein